MPPPPLSPPVHRRDPALDGLRGLAVLMVFIYHYGGGLSSSSLIVVFMGYLVETGWIGVVLFFALSGFLITGSLWDSIDKPHCLRNFYARRALRILPLYFGALLLAVFVSVSRGATVVQLQPLAIYAFFLQDLPHLAARALVNPSPLPLYHLWTLAVEEQYYLLWPLLLLVPTRRRSALNLSLFIFILAVIFRVVVYGLPRYTGIHNSEIYNNFLFTHIGALALGSAMALALRSSRTGRKSTSSRSAFKNAQNFFIGGIVVYLACSAFSFSLYLNSPLQYMVSLPAISIAAVSLIPMALRPGAVRSIFSTPLLVKMGRLSYGFYIFHLLLQPIFDFFAYEITRVNWGPLYQTVRCLVAFGITLFVSWLSYRVLELPFLQRKREFPMAPSLPPA